MQTIGDSPISLYFHIPFCKKKCDYCHFYVIPEKEESKTLLLHSLEIEWKNYLPLLKKKKIVSIYFGGGTPSLFGPGRISEILDWVFKETTVAEDVEITLEANPENITFSLIEAYKKAGINRLSIGVQSLEANLLEILGRNHPPSTAMRSIYTAAEAGISNLSIDLMYDLPHQTLEDWAHTLEQIENLPISHLSLYNLTIEPHTIFFKNRKHLVPKLPSEETSLAMYEMAIDKMEKRGLLQYEISAFAKPGCISRHNSGYWTGRPFLGLGPSAFSFWEGKRFQNVPHLKKYAEALKEGASPVHFEEALDPEALRRELFVIQLRLKQGVDLAKFEKTFGKLQESTTMQLLDLEKKGWIHFGSTVSLSKQGILFYDSVASELI